MAVGFAVAGPEAGGEVDARRYGGQVTAFVALSCVTAAMGGAIFGYDIQTAGGMSSMDTFLRGFFPDVYSQLLTLFTSSLYIAGLVTAVLLASWVTARHGCRPSMILASAADMKSPVVD